MEDTEVTYVELWVGMAQVKSVPGEASPIKRGAKYAHVWCASHAQDQADFEARAGSTLAAQGLAVAAFDQVSLAEDMNVIPDELFTLVARAQQDEQNPDQHQAVFFGDLLYLTANQRPS